MFFLLIVGWIFFVNTEGECSEKILQVVNQLRSEAVARGIVNAPLPPLQLSSKLTRTAQEYANEIPRMIIKEQMTLIAAHKDCQGRSSRKRLEAVGIASPCYTAIAENFSISYSSDLKRIINLLSESEEHKMNIYGSFTHTGFGMSKIACHDVNKLSKGNKLKRLCKFRNLSDYVYIFIQDFATKNSDSLVTDSKSKLSSSLVSYVDLQKTVNIPSNTHQLQITISMSKNETQ